MAYASEWRKLPHPPIFSKFGKQGLSLKKFESSYLFIASSSGDKTETQIRSESFPPVEISQLSVPKTLNPLIGKIGAERIPKGIPLI